MSRRVLIADEHPMVRELLGEVEIIEAETLHEVLGDVVDDGLHPAVLDLSMPDGDPTDLVEAIRVQAPRLPLLVFTMHEDPALAVRLLRAGVDGYVSKTRPPVGR